MKKNKAKKKRGDDALRDDFILSSLPLSDIWEDVSGCINKLELKYENNGKILSLPNSPFKKDHQIDLEQLIGSKISSSSILEQQDKIDIRDDVGSIVGLRFEKAKQWFLDVQKREDCFRSPEEAVSFIKRSNLYAEFAQFRTFCTKIPKDVQTQIEALYRELQSIRNSKNIKDKLQYNKTYEEIQNLLKKHSLSHTESLFLFLEKYLLYNSRLRDLGICFFRQDCPALHKIGKNRVSKEEFAILMPIVNVCVSSTINGVVKKKLARYKYFGDGDQNRDISQNGDELHEKNIIIKDIEEYLSSTGKLNSKYVTCFCHLLSETDIDIDSLISFKESLENPDTLSSIIKEIKKSYKDQKSQEIKKDLAPKKLSSTSGQGSILDWSKVFNVSKSTFYRWYKQYCPWSMRINPTKSKQGAIRLSEEEAKEIIRLGKAKEKWRDYLVKQGCKTRSASTKLSRLRKKIKTFKDGDIDPLIPLYLKQPTEELFKAIFTDNPTPEELYKIINDRDHEKVTVTPASRKKNNPSSSK
jgi:hypothetical protein